MNLTPPDEIATTIITAEEQFCGRLTQIEKASDTSVVTVHQDLNLLERDQPLLNHFVNYREKRGYLFLAVDYLDYDWQVLRESKDFRGVNTASRPISH